MKCRHRVPQIYTTDMPGNSLSGPAWVLFVNMLLHRKSRLVPIHTFVFGTCGGFPFTSTSTFEKEWPSHSLFRCMFSLPWCVAPVLSCYCPRFLVSDGNCCVCLQMMQPSYVCCPPLSNFLMSVSSADQLYLLCTHCPNDDNTLNVVSFNSWTECRSKPWHPDSR